uniref:Sulfatase N-terminal domain-containing protein n=1 Tax=Hyaloperonospora arabidopsidis (strain Emoy2) TaxID=559515 RepID=M4BBE8_HYAAE
MVHFSSPDKPELDRLQSTIPKATTSTSQVELTVTPSLMSKLLSRGGLFRARAELDYPWLGWAFVYVYSVFFLFVYRCSALNGLIAMYADANDKTLGVVLGALLLGFLQDSVCITYFVCLLWTFDSFINVVIKYFGCRKEGTMTRVISKMATFAMSWILFMATMLPVVADVVVVRLRDIRFTFDLIVLAIQEKDNVSSFDVSPEQLRDAYVNATVIVVAASCFALVRTHESWADLARWNPTQMPLSFGTSHAYDSLSSTRETTNQLQDAGNSEGTTDTTVLVDATKVTEADLTNGTNPTRYVTVEIDDDSDSSDAEETVVADDDTAQILSVDKPQSKEAEKCQTFKQTVIALVGLVLSPIIVVAVSSACSPLVAYLALNTTLNEMLGRSLQPALDGDYSLLDDGNLPWVETFIHRATEEHKLYGDDTLYRRTTGFKGDLAFDVDVSSKDPPNVLLIVIESFRFHDSRYLVDTNDPSGLFNGTNITITPNFDRWAQRGIALTNYWSSWRTSRSVESLLFGQLPYDHITKSGMTGGQLKTNLSGLPQLFSAKGYETFFTTGCRTNYDGWDTFLPHHGFDTVWSRDQFVKIAEKDHGIKREDWKGQEHRGFNWGVHDDVSFQILGDLMINETKLQAARVAHGKSKKPLFLTHYTISSHVNYKARPRWYDQSKKPDFSPLYKGHKYADNIKKYLEIRYFTDLEFGKFMDRMAEAGILNDTIVVISGDHGQAPEFGNDTPQNREVSVTRVAGAIVAEGRLGKDAGMVLDDATEQYDILNTLADIVGVPEGGFDQDGAGRSLKRKVEFGQRSVYSNDPVRKMSVVRGHERLRYDRVTDSILLHDANKDHDMQHDLLPGLSEEKRSEWIRMRDNGRRINSYYKKRWEGNCLLAAQCE